MKRTQANRDKLARQCGDFARGLHYGKVEQVALEKIKARERGERIDIIMKHGIRDSMTVTLPNGTVKKVKSIHSTGILILENGVEIDPKNLP